MTKLIPFRFTLFLAAVLIAIAPTFGGTETTKPANAGVLKQVAPYLIVKDVVASAAYYKDKLGFAIDGSPGPAPSFTFVKRDGINLILRSVPQVAPAPNHTKSPEAGWDAYIWVTDAKALCQEFKQRGAIISSTLNDTTHGTREFEVQDFDGYILCFGQVL